MDINEGSEPCTRSESYGKQDTNTDTDWNEAFVKGPWCKEQVIYMKDTWRFLSHILDIQVMA